MKNKLILFCIAASLVTNIAAQQRILSDTEKIVGLSRLWEGVRSNYVYYDKIQIDWDSLYEKTIPKVLEIKDTYEYLRELERFVAHAKDGHTYIGHNEGPKWDERIKPLPFTTKWVGNKVLVDKVWSSEFVKKGIVRGTEIVSINNLDVFTYAKEELGQYIPSSTPQWTYHQAINSYELTKGKCIDPITVEYANNGKKFTVAYPDRESMDWDIQQNQSNSEQANEPAENGGNGTIKFTLLDGNIGLLRIDHFNDSEMNKLFNEIYPKILSTDGLVIDLRDNGGGNSGYADYILRHFSQKPIKTSSWSSRMYIPAHASWGYDDEWYMMASGDMNPVSGKEIYTKPISVLVDAGTFSSSEDFCVKFRGMKRGPIIGTPTGGSTGNGVRITLIKDVAMANICSKKDIAPDGTVFVGVGVIPDIVVEDTPESFMANKDIVLERGISEVKK